MNETIKKEFDKFICGKVIKFGSMRYIVLETNNSVIARAIFFVYRVYNIDLNKVESYWFHAADAEHLLKYKYTRNKGLVIIS